MNNLVFFPPLGTFLKNGPMFLSDTESDSDENEEPTAPPPRSKIPIRADPQRRSLSFNGPPPPYTEQKNDNRPSVISMNSKTRRAMQNL